MRHMEMTCQVFVLEVLDCLLQDDDVPFHRDVFFDGARFQLRMRRRLCSRNRLGTSLLTRYSGFGEECLLSCASRKLGLALFQLAKWRSKVAAGSTFTQAENPSRMDETASS